MKKSQSYEYRAYLYIEMNDFNRASIDLDRTISLAPNDCITLIIERFL